MQSTTTTLLKLSPRSQAIDVGSTSSNPKLLTISPNLDHSGKNATGNIWPASFLTISCWVQISVPVIWDSGPLNLVGLLPSIRTPQKFQESNDDLSSMVASTSISDSYYSTIGVLGPASKRYLLQVQGKEPLWFWLGNSVRWCCVITTKERETQH